MNSICTHTFQEYIIKQINFLYSTFSMWEPRRLIEAGLYTNSKLLPHLLQSCSRGDLFDVFCQTALLYFVGCDDWFLCKRRLLWQLPTDRQKSTSGFRSGLCGAPHSSLERRARSRFLNRRCKYAIVSFGVCGGAAPSCMNQARRSWFGLRISTRSR